MSRSVTCPDGTMTVLCSSGRARKILFASAHAIVDFSNGASVATLDMLHGLCASGFRCCAFCMPKLDLPGAGRLEQFLTIPESFTRFFRLPSAPSVHGSFTRNVVTFPITVVNLDSTPQVGHRPDDVQTVLGFFRSFLEIEQPDVMLTYGGDPITNGMIDMARRRRIPVVFAIHNLCYLDPTPFANVDHCLVPSQFAQRYYRDRVGLDCHSLPNPVDWDRVRADDPAPQFLTFINPSLQKGAYPLSGLLTSSGGAGPTSRSWSSRAGNARHAGGVRARSWPLRERPVHAQHVRSAPFGASRRSP